MSPSPAGDRFFSVPDAYVPGNDSSRFRAMLAFNVPLAPILTRTDNQTGQSADIVAEQFVSYLDVGYFPTKWLLVNADIPLVLSQSGDGRSAPSGSALGDARVGLRVPLLGGENAGFSLAPALDVWLPTGSVDQLTGDGRVRGSCRRCWRADAATPSFGRARSAINYVARTTAVRRRSAMASCWVAPPG